MKNIIRYNVGAFGIPQSAVLNGNLNLTYSRHAIEEVVNDEQGNFVKYIPKAINTSNGEAQLMEVEVENGRSIKWLYRVKLFKNYDLVLVVIENDRKPGEFFVKTAWVNKNDYPHIIKDITRYEKP